MPVFEIRAGHHVPYSIYIDGMPYSSHPNAPVVGVEYGYAWTMWGAKRKLKKIKAAWEQKVSDVVYHREEGN